MPSGFWLGLASGKHQHEFGGWEERGGVVNLLAVTLGRFWLAATLCTRSYLLAGAVSAHLLSVAFW